MEITNQSLPRLLRLHRILSLLKMWLTETRCEQKSNKKGSFCLCLPFPSSCVSLIWLCRAANKAKPSLTRAVTAVCLCNLLSCYRFSFVTCVSQSKTLGAIRNNRQKSIDGKVQSDAKAIMAQVLGKRKPSLNRSLTGSKPLGSPNGSASSPQNSNAVSFEAESAQRMLKPRSPRSTSPTNTSANPSASQPKLSSESGGKPPSLMRKASGFLKPVSEGASDKGPAQQVVVQQKVTHQEASTDLGN